jgi:hypothetical protein
MKAEESSSKNETTTWAQNVGDAAPDFLGHLQQRLGIDDRSAVARLQFWLSTYQPGPAALAHLRRDGRDVL